MYVLKYKDGTYVGGATGVSNLDYALKFGSVSTATNYLQRHSDIDFDINIYEIETTVKAVEVPKPNMVGKVVVSRADVLPAYFAVGECGFMNITTGRYTPYENSFYSSDDFASYEVVFDPTEKG